MQAPRTDVCNLGATVGFNMISNSKSGRPKNSSCASLFCCCHALVLKYHLVQRDGIKRAESMSDAIQDLLNVQRSERRENTNIFSSKDQNPKALWWTIKMNQGFPMTDSMCIAAVTILIISRWRSARVMNGINSI